MIFRFSSHTSSFKSWRFFIYWFFVRFLSSIPHWVRRFFTNNIILWNLSAFLQGWNVLIDLLVFLLSLPHWLRGFSPGYHFKIFFNRWLPHSTELTSKKKDNCNDMPQNLLIIWSWHMTSHLISIHDHLYNLNTWPTNSILTSSHWYRHLHDCISMS